MFEWCVYIITGATSFLFFIAGMSTKRTLSKDFERPGVSPKQPRIEGSPLSLPHPQPIIFSTNQPLTIPVRATSPAGSSGTRPAQTLLGITGLPTSSARKFEFPTQIPQSISNPSGIIPLPPQPVRITPPSVHPSSIPHLSAAIPGISSLNRPLATVQFSTDHSIPTPSIAPNSAPPQAIGGSYPVLPGVSVHDVPPPPYPVLEGATEEFGCSSPSQFLCSPTAIQSTTPASQLSSGSMETEDRSSQQNKASESTKELRLKLARSRKAKMAAIKSKYENMLREKFFLEAGGNMMDYQVWKRRPNILKEQYMKQHDLDSETSGFEELLSPHDHLSQTRDKMDTEGILEQESPLELESIARNQQQPTFQKVRSTRQLTTSGRPSLSSPGPLQTPNTSLSQLGTPHTPHSQLASPSLTSPRPPLRSHSISSVAETSHEDIVMKARHEAEVMKAISELRKEGMWSASRLPKVQEPAKIKSHWDYLLEEMQWLATDFHNERRWKINAAKKVNLLYISFTQ